MDSPHNHLATPAEAAAVVEALRRVAERARARLHAVKIRGLRWWMIGLLMLGSILNYLTRSTLAVAAPTILQNLHITAKQYSWIVGTFQGTIMLQPAAATCWT